MGQWENLVEETGLSVAEEVSSSYFCPSSRVHRPLIENEWLAQKFKKDSFYLREAQQVDIFNN